MALIAHRRLFLIAPKSQLPLTGSISPIVSLSLLGNHEEDFRPLVAP